MTLFFTIFCNLAGCSKKDGLFIYVDFSDLREESVGLEEKNFVRCVDELKKKILLPKDFSFDKTQFEEFSMTNVCGSERY